MKALCSYAAVGIFLLFFLAGCRKNIDSPEIQVNNTSVKDGIPVYPLSWQTADYMPTPVANTVLVPWGSGANEEYDATDLAFDYLSNDGWQLVYNTFNTTALTSPEFFALYNVYRGLYRVYFYYAPESYFPSTYLQEGISLTGSASTPLLNYTTSDVVDYNTNQTSMTTISNYQVQSTSGWYVLQFEMAYDPNISNVNYQNLETTWNVSSVQVTQSSFYGTDFQTITGSVTTPGTGFNLVSTAENLVLDLSGIGELSTLISTATGAEKAVLTATNAGVTSSLGGTIKNIFSAILGGSSATKNSVNLTMNGSFSFTGNSTSTTAIANPTLIIPGTQWTSSAAGYLPGYNSPLGVFYISAKPTIDEHITTKTNGGITGTTTTIAYSIKSSSYSLLFNPAVTAIASIQNIKTSVVVLGTPSAGESFSGTPESIGDLNVYTGVTQISGPLGTFSPPVAIRVSFNVVPNNGAPTSTIVKTFAANLVQD
jgi:hypothetical protein